MKKLIYLLYLIPYFTHAMTLDDACGSDNVTQMQALLAQDKTILSTMDAKGALPIHKAAFKGSINVLQLLVDTNPQSINAPDKLGNIPFTHIVVGYMQLKENIKKMEIPRNCVRMELLSMKPSLEVMEAREAQKFEDYKKAATLMISKNANLEIPNAMGYKWTAFADIDKELSQDLVAHIHTLLEKK